MEGMDLADTDLTRTGGVHPQTYHSNRSNRRFKAFFKQIELQSMILPGMICLIIFSYIPMYGIIVSFQEYNIAKGIGGSAFVGLKQFYDFINDPAFFSALRNTLAINLIGLVIGFPAPIIFAILLNELRNQKFKKVTQTVSYLPYFISWVIFGGLIIRFLSVENGVINDVLVSLHIIPEAISWLGKPQYFWYIAVFTNILKNLGFGAIIYLAAIAGIDHEMIEASIIDGVGRLGRIIHIIIPSISGTIIIFLILTISGILNSGFDQIWMLQNNLTLDMSEVLDTYVYKIGLSQMRLSYATAVGLTRSVIAFILLLSANFFSNKLTDKGLF
jgi:putative aldouronate transport system permease protein